MELKIKFWLTSLDLFLRGFFDEGCATMFPLADKAAKARRINLSKNKERLVAYFTDEIENAIELGTGISLKFVDGSKKIILQKKSLGEIIYELRCNILHEADKPKKLFFSPTMRGCVEFASKDDEIIISQDYMFLLLFCILASPEYTSVSKDFSLGRVRFGDRIFNPSECVGKFHILKNQLSTQHKI